MSECLVTGAAGALGSVLMRVLAEERRTSLGMVSHSGLRPHVGKVFAAELSDERSYEQRLFSFAPKVIVHLAAVSQVAPCYDEPERAHQVNVQATARLLRFADALGARFVFASTDLVFDGEHAPYQEDATPNPRSLYGRTKLEAECHVLAYKRGLVVRLPLMYGFPDADRPPTFFAKLVNALQSGEPVALFADEVRTPLWLDDAAHACLALADSSLTGVVHAAGPERLSRYEMGLAVASQLAVSPSLVSASVQRDVPVPEARARDVSLDGARFRAHFGRSVGRTLREALPLLFAHRASPRLS